MFCPRCGNKMNNSGEFCPMCGLSLKKPSKRKNRAKTRAMYIISGCLFFVSILLLVGIFVLSAKIKENQEELRTDEIIADSNEDNPTTDDTNSDEDEEENDQITSSTEEASEIEELKGHGELIGIAFPYEEGEYGKIGHYIESALTDKGYKVDLQFDNNSDNNDELCKQLETMIEEKCNVIVLHIKSKGNTAKQTNEENDKLEAVFEKVKASDISIVTLSLSNWYPSSFATYFSYHIGWNKNSETIIRARYIKEKLDLDNTTTPYNVAIDDIDAVVWDCLDSYIDSGIIKVKPYRKSIAASSDAILCNDDRKASEIIADLTEAGVQKYPIITGAGCSLEGVKSIISGKQSMTTWENSTILADRAITMIGQIVNGENIESNDVVSDDSGEYPAYYCDPMVIDTDNYQIVFDSGLFSEEDLL